MRVLKIISLAIILFTGIVNADEVGNKNRKANKLYNKGKYEEALKLYDEALLLEPSNGKLKMNRGSAQYKLEDFDGAESSYLDALSSKIDKKVQADAHYNLGNVLYKQGERLESAGDAASARKKYSQALESYINTLKMRPNDKDAKWNLQRAHQKVELMEEQEQQQQQGDDNQEGGDQNREQDGSGDKKDDKNKDGGKDGDGQSQDGQEQQGPKQEQEGQSERDMKQEEAQRLIEQYADDADTLNKPRFMRGRVRQPEKDW